MARLIHENPDTKSRMPLATLTKTLFEKRSIYYPLPGYEPTAQAERRLFRSGQVVCLKRKKVIEISIFYLSLCRERHIFVLISRLRLLIKNSFCLTIYL